MVLSSELSYNNFKNICYDKNCISQVAVYKTLSGKKGGISVVSNILRQINSKLGGDLYNIQFPKDMPSHTMLLGIDVCHQGPKSIVGFCATINKELS